MAEMLREAGWEGKIFKNTPSGEDGGWGWGAAKVASCSASSPSPASHGVSNVRPQWEVSRL